MREVLPTQLADDTNLFIKDIASLKNTINILDHFFKCAGLWLNKDKTDANLLGQKKNICLKQFSIKIVEKTFNSLWIKLCKNTKSMYDYKFDEKI